MIGQLIATMIMAIGIATGNVSSNAYKGGNVLNTSQETKPQTKKAVQNINLDYDTGSLKSSYYQYTAANHPYFTGYEKYYLKPYGQAEQVSDGYMQMTEYGIIYNSVYKLNDISLTNNNRYVITNIVYIKFSIYAETVNNYQVQSDILVNAIGNGNSWMTKNVYQGIGERDELLDLTMTANTNQYITSELADTNKWQILDHADNGYTMTGTSFHVSTESSNILIHRGETIYLAIETTIDTALTNTQSGDSDNIQLTIKGHYIENVYNYEVVDIPNLMFTILTMPFSFASTAFNLTIFPGTPYQVNFSNLFMVLLGAFILLWIIRKVF